MTLEYTMVLYEIIFHELWYIEQYGATVGDGCVAKRNLIKNINWICRYTFRYLILWTFSTLNTAVKMILMLKRTNSNL